MTGFREKTEQQILSTIGESIRGSRIAQDMTLEELAKMSDINKMTLSRIENGKTNPTIMVLFRIFKSLNREREIEQIFPPPTESPLLLSKQAKSRDNNTLPMRVRKKDTSDEEWSWED